MAWRRSSHLLSARIGQYQATQQQNVRFIAARHLSASSSSQSSGAPSTRVAGSSSSSGFGVRAGDWAALLAAVALG